MAKKKEAVTAEPSGHLSEIVELLQNQGRTDLALKILADQVSRPFTAPTAAEIAEEREQAQRSFQSEHDRQRQEQHYWVTFNRMGESDNVDIVDIGAAGVMYHIRKGHRVPLPESAINALKLAVRVGWDYGRPIVRDGKRYLRKITETDYSYVIEGACSPEEAAEWREEQRRNEPQNAELLPIDRGTAEGDLMEIGAL